MKSVTMAISDENGVVESVLSGTVREAWVENETRELRSQDGFTESELTGRQFLRVVVDLDNPVTRRPVDIALRELIRAAHDALAV